MKAINLRVEKVLNVTERIDAEYSELRISADVTTGDGNKVTYSNGQLYNEDEQIGNFSWSSGNISLNLSKAQSFDVVSIITSFIKDVEESKVNTL